MTQDAKIEAVAKAIYMTHWRPPGPPPWESASDKVKAWVRKQAASAIAAGADFEELNDPIPEL